MGEHPQIRAPIHSLTLPPSRGLKVGEGCRDLMMPGHPGAPDGGCRAQSWALRPPVSRQGAARHPRLQGGRGHSLLSHRGALGFLQGSLSVREGVIGQHPGYGGLGADVILGWDS